MTEHRQIKVTDWIKGLPTKERSWQKKLRGLPDCREKFCEKLPPTPAEAEDAAIG